MPVCFAFINMTYCVIAAPSSFSVVCNIYIRANLKKKTLRILGGWGTLLGYFLHVRDKRATAQPGSQTVSETCVPLLECHTAELCVL